MNAATKMAVGTLAVFIGGLGWMRYNESPQHIQWEIDHNPQFAPNTCHRVQEPPPFGPEAVEQKDQMLKAIAAEVDKKLDVQLRAIREEQARKNRTLLIDNPDQKTIDHTHMRKMYNVHE